MTTAELLLLRFRGRSDYVAVQNGDGFEPFNLRGLDLQPSWIEQRHLSGEKCLGFYLLTKDNKCYCTAADFDNKPDHPDPEWLNKTEKTYYSLCRMGLQPLVEMSQSGTAAHVWLFFSEPTDAWIPRAFWRVFGEKNEVPIPEVYPRQDKLRDQNAIGNLIRYPLWNHSRFVDVENEWAEILPPEALGNVQAIEGSQLKLIAYECGMGELRPDPTASTEPGSEGLSVRVKERLVREHSLLARRWNGDMTGLNDQSRSALCQSIACELVRTYVPTPEIEAAIEHWCKKNGYAKGERDDWVSNLVRKAYDFVLQRQEKKTLLTGTLEQAALAYLDKLTSKAPLFVPSGLGELDKSIDGVGFGEMAVIAARPGHGKSSFALQWVDKASKDGVPSLILSEEMSMLELGHRTVLSICDTPEIYWPDVLPSLADEVREHYKTRKNVYVVESPHSIDRVDELIDQYVSLYGVRLVAVDYLQLIDCKANSRYETVTEISKRLKKAATRNDCAILALCQLNRGIEDPKRRWRPRLSDLRESGQIEADSDLIMFLMWPHRFDSGEPKEKYAIEIAKRRNGPIRDPRVLTQFNPERQIFGTFTTPEPAFAQYDGRAAASGGNYEPVFDTPTEF
jgi:KaiC/GvpD/RAD55 family RecA-like ATPase